MILAGTVITGIGIDPNAQAFITAASITDTSQIVAINTLVLQLKEKSIWSKLKAVYPFVGGTASTHKFNLINPVDTDAGFRLTFTGGWTHSSTGALPNGTNAYADSFFSPYTQYTVDDDAHLCFYSRTDTSIVSVDIGCTNSVGNYYHLLSIRRSDASNNSYYGINVSDAAANFAVKSADPTSRAFYLGTRTGTVTNGWKNSTKDATNTGATSLRPNYNVWLGAQNYSGSPAAGFYSNREYAFASIGQGLTDTNVTDYYTAVQAYQTSLSRQI